jgi:hypothetical protein
MSLGGDLKLLVFWSRKLRQGLLLSLGPRLPCFGDLVDRRGTRTLARICSHERRKMFTGLSLIETQVIIQQIQQLFLHQVDLRHIEEDSIVGPVAVLWRRVVEIFGSHNQRGEEDAMPRTGKTCWSLSKSVSESEKE